MSHRVHATVEEVQAFSGDRAIDHTRANSELEQLATCDDPVLRLRKPRDSPVPPLSPQFTPHTGVKCGLVGNLPAGGATS